MPHNIGGEGACADAAPLEQSSFYKIDHCGDKCREHNPEQLIPVEKMNAREFRACHIVEARPAESDEGNNEKQKNGAEPLP